MHPQTEKQQHKHAKVAPGCVPFRPTSTSFIMHINWEHPVTIQPLSTVTIPLGATVKSLPAKLLPSFVMLGTRCFANPPTTTTCVLGLAITYASLQLICSTMPTSQILTSRIGFAGIAIPF
jgi:hypothetical protein